MEKKNYFNEKKKIFDAVGWKSYCSRLGRWALGRWGAQAWALGRWAGRWALG